MREEEEERGEERGEGKRERRGEGFLFSLERGGEREGKGIWKEGDEEEGMKRGNEKMK